METRENRILELLKNKKSYLTGKQLAKMLGVSDRSIRNDIVNLNSRYPGIIDSSVRYGYKLNEEVLEQSDIVSLHLPVTPETEYMADFDFFHKMKEGSYFVNTSRGELVEDDALIHALASGKLAMAGLDTLDCEPVQKDHVLLEQPREISRRIIFSPHIGGITGASFARSMTMVLEDIKTVEEGGRPARAV